eukprot:m.151051 g.151051  ORF g.151051 m.151051 type:complete len:371 (-) comp15033_c0_seq11:176-1288(-)
MGDDAKEFVSTPPPCFGLDVGGTLCKICYFEKSATPEDTPAEILFREKMRQIIDDEVSYGSTGHRDVDLEFDSDELGGHVYFSHFATRTMNDFLEMVKSNKVVDKDTLVYGTGGGARKYADRIKDRLDISVKFCDELASLILGINFMLRYHPMEAYTVNYQTFRDDQERSFINKPQFPYLLVNIGSGVSIMKIYKDGSHERVGGTSLGGSSFFGLCSMLSGCTSFAEALEFAAEGDARNVDLLVEDIYGGDYSEYNLSADLTASSFGKLTHPDVKANARKEDLARAILDSITNNIGSLAILHAKLHNVEEIVFAGNFLRKNSISIARLAFAVHYWSEGARKGIFLKHEGYHGAIGALISTGKGHYNWMFT